MSEMATEISGSEHMITDLEFLGRTFEERRQALRQVEAFRKFTEEALLDSVAVFKDQEVRMTFRPSSITSRQYPGYWVPCYSLFDDERVPIEKDVTIRKVTKDSVVVSEGELSEDKFDTMWSVGVRNIISISPLEETADQPE